MTKPLSKSELHSFPPGKILVKENDSSRKLFIIKEGMVRVYKTYLGKKVTLAELGKGEIFGELSFFDAEPRSASVETLTRVEALVVDGECASEQIQNLPHWVSSILKAVFYRFRETDQKLTILQNMADFKKQSFNTDAMGQVIYLELLRFNKMLKIIYDKSSKNDSEINYSEFQKELDDVLGKKQITLKTYLATLVSNNILILDSGKKESLLNLDEKYLEEFNEYLNREIETERYLVLGHKGLNVLRATVGFMGEKSEDEEVFIKDIPITSVPFLEEGMDELLKIKYSHVKTKIF